MPLEDASDRPDLTDFEAALGSLRPTPTAGRDRILFRAGVASVAGRSRRRAWPALAAGLAAVAIGEAAMLAHRPPPQIVERIVVIREPTSTKPGPPPGTVAVANPIPSTPTTPTGQGWSARTRLTDQLLRQGLEGLPNSTSSVGSSNRLPLLSGRDLLRQELRSALFSGDRS